MSSQSKLLCAPTAELRCWDYTATDVYCLPLDRKWQPIPHTEALGGLEGSLGYFPWLPVLPTSYTQCMSIPNVAAVEGLLSGHFSEAFLDSSGEYSHIGHLLRAF